MVGGTAEDEVLLSFPAYLVSHAVGLAVVYCEVIAKGVRHDWAQNCLVAFCLFEINRGSTRASGR